MRLGQVGSETRTFFRPLKIIRVHGWCVPVACILDLDPEAFKDSGDPEAFKDSRILCGPRGTPSTVFCSSRSYYCAFRMLDRESGERCSECMSVWIVILNIVSVLMICKILTLLNIIMTIQTSYQILLSHHKWCLWVALQSWKTKQHIHRNADEEMNSSYNRKCRHHKF